MDFKRGHLVNDFLGGFILDIEKCVAREAVDSSDIDLLPDTAVDDAEKFLRPDSVHLSDIDEKLGEAFLTLDLHMFGTFGLVLRLRGLEVLVILVVLDESVELERDEALDDLLLVKPAELCKN